MTLRAVALLKLSRFTPPLGSGARVQTLDDAVLLDTGELFAAEPEDLQRKLLGIVGAELSEHDDPRGVLIVPSVAVPSARSYAGVVAEVGEGGQWLPLPAAHDPDADGFALPDGLGGLAAVFGSMLQHMPEAVLEAASAAARGDEAGFSAVGEHVSAMMGHVAAKPGASPGVLPDFSGAAGLLGMLSGAGLDVSSPAFQQALATVQAELARDPERVKALAEQLFGAAADDPDE